MNVHALDEAVQRTFQEWGIPGGAVAIISKGETLVKGYGVREAGKPEPVDADTIFAIGSTTKAFTAASIAMLVDSGQLNWDDPVIKHIPDFEVFDPWITQHLTVRDLLCQRIGLEGAQREYYHGSYSKRDKMKRMRYLKPLVEFRDDFYYANQQFTLAGLLVEILSGKSWDDFVTERIYSPLGMDRSLTGYSGLAGKTNIASPHAVLDEDFPANVRFLGRFEAIPWFKLNSEPSGSVHTCAADLAKWLQFLLKNGSPWIKPESFKELTSPQMIMHNPGESEIGPLYALQPPTHFWTYGMGWWVLDYCGEKVCMHGGLLPGFNSMVAFLPEKEIGIAVTVNVHETLAHASLFYTLMDILLDQPGRDWCAEYKMVAEGYMAQTRAGVQKKLANRLTDTSPSLPLEKYTGTYTSELYGDLAVGLEKGRLTLIYGQISAELEHWQEDSFLAHWNLKGLSDDTFIAFAADASEITLVNDRAKYVRK